MSVLLLPSMPATATSIDPLTYPEIVSAADFLGVVECKTAGGIVARYQVIDSWKGSENGKEVLIRTTPDVWGPQFPIALCGERLLVAGYKPHPYGQTWPPGYCRPPLWWRDIAVDYETPLFQGVARLPLKEGRDAFKMRGHSLEEMKQSAERLLGLYPEEREAAVLRALIEKYFAGANETWPEPALVAAKELKEAVERESSPPEIVELLIRMANHPDQKFRWAVFKVLDRGAGTITLEAVKSLPKTTQHASEFESVLSSIESRLGLSPVQSAPPPPARPAAPADLAELRAELHRSGTTAYEVREAIEELSVHDPESVAKYLVAWKNPEKDWSDRHSGYRLGSYFARLCGRDREKNLKALLEASDPWIRVSGAVYLCFEDREEGMRELRELQKLEDDPGVWAALTLARRGDKAAMARALEVFDTAGEDGMAGVTHRNLKLSLAVLLSNTANRSGLPQPEYSVEEETSFQSFRAWWSQYGGKATLYDPWSEELDKRKID